MTRRTRGRIAAAALAVAAGGVVPGALAGQGVRGWTSSNLQYVELRPVLQDTVSRDRLTVGPGGHLFLDGDPVFCAASGTCTYYRARDVEHAFAGTQDVGLTAWGFGMQGLSFTGLVRGRARLDGDFVWPRSDDHFDALLAYAQLDRGPVRARLGRQETLSGLGFTGYDGANVQYEPFRSLAVEAYGGRSLARGLSQPRDQALRGLIDFLPEEDAWLVGAFVNARFRSNSDVGLRYQREIWGDRHGLVSERASVDARTDLFRPLHLDASADWDVAFGRVGKAHLTARWLEADRPWALEVTGRRYLPYFELSTVWGFFSPVAYHEVLARGSWTWEPGMVWAEGGWRTYGETHTVTIFDPLEGDGWRVEAGGRWRVAEEWSVEGRYDLEWGVGAFLNAGDVTVRYRPSERLRLAATGTAFQRFEEFRVGEGKALGTGLQVGFDVTDRVGFDGGVSLYRHDPEGGQVNEAWNQARGWSSLRIEFGNDPGRPARRFRR